MSSNPQTIFAPAFLCYVLGSFQLRLFAKLESARDAEKADEEAQHLIDEQIESNASLM